MYIGLGPESGKRVTDEDAFSYACACCNTGDKEEQETFMQLAKESGSIEEFAEELVSWFFSGNWLYKEEISWD